MTSIWGKNEKNPCCLSLINWLKQLKMTFLSIFSSLKQFHCTLSKSPKWPFVLIQFRGQGVVALVKDVLCYRNKHKNTVFQFIWPLLMTNQKTTTVHYLNRRGPNFVLWNLAKNGEILINLSLKNCLIAQFFKICPNINDLGDLLA